MHEKVYEKVRDLLAAKVAALKKGDPLDESTFIGPIISENDAKRVEASVESAVKAGAKLLAGGKRDGVMHGAHLDAIFAPNFGVFMSCFVF